MGEEKVSAVRTDVYSFTVDTSWEVEILQWVWAKNTNIRVSSFISYALTRECSITVIFFIAYFAYLFTIEINFIQETLKETSSKTTAAAAALLAWSSPRSQPV